MEIVLSFVPSLAYIAHAGMCIVFLRGICQDSARLIPTGPKGGPTRGGGPTFLV